jgi:hypothetical protein
MKEPAVTRLSRRTLLGGEGAGLGALVAGSLVQTIPDEALADLAAYDSRLR